jgi:hypothetical protein
MGFGMFFLAPFFLLEAPWQMVLVMAIVDT